MPLNRALALLAAVFAISLSVFMPTAAAAASGSETPIRLCAGRMSDLVIVDGRVRKTSDREVVISNCAFVFAGQTAIPAPPSLAPAPRVCVSDTHIRVETRKAARPPARAPPRPPSTAPPHA